MPEQATIKPTKTRSPTRQRPLDDHDEEKASATDNCGWMREQVPPVPTDWGLAPMAVSLTALASLGGGGGGGADFAGLSSMSTCWRVIVHSSPARERCRRIPSRASPELPVVRSA